MGTGGGACLPPAPLPAAAACCARNCAIKEPSLAKLMFIDCVSGLPDTTTTTLSQGERRTSQENMFLEIVHAELYAALYAAIRGVCLFVGRCAGEWWAGIMRQQKLTPLKTKSKAHNTSNLSSPVPPGSSDEQQVLDASAKKKGKKVSLSTPFVQVREPPAANRRASITAPEGAGLVEDCPPRAEFDSIYVPAKLERRRESLGGMAGNWSPRARLSRVGSGPVTSRCASIAPPPQPRRGSLTGRTNRARVRAGSTR